MDPWNGIANFVDASGRLEGKDEIIKLEGREKYRTSLKIEIEG
ncbi:hypothetical protein [Psychrilyobacter sp.]